jgi:hypothetical protein
MIGLDLLGKAAKNVGELANCVAKFASWCSTAETVISSWERQVMSAEGRRLSRVRISIARKRWGVLQKDYEVYKRSVSDLHLPPVYSDPIYPLFGARLTY